MTRTSHDWHPPWEAGISSQDFDGGVLGKHGVPLDTQIRDESSKAMGTVRDGRDMANMGKRQQLNRNFGFMSMLGFSSTLMATWEALPSVFLGGLLNGGPVALVYGYIFCFFGTLASCASLAELASMTPTSGGQYHWTAQLASRRWSAQLSWVVGWISVLAWQAVTASAAFLGGTMIQGLIILNNESYTPERWHGTLIFYAIILLSVSINTVGARFLPYLEGIILIIHIIGFFAVLIPLVYLAPQSPASFVFTDFENQGGWSSNGLSWCVGLITSTYPFICYDGACHMSEEIEDASIVVPRSMIATIFLNGAMGFGMLLGLLFGIGDLDVALNSPTGFPFIQIFYGATESTRGATAMTSVIITISIAATCGLMASASRQTWAFARDNGLPFSRYFARVSSRLAIPTRAVVLVTVVNLLLGLINIGSTTAFNAIISLSTVTLYITYAVPVILLVKKRLQGESIHFGPFTLGRFGLGINIFAVTYGTFTSIFLFFPPVTPTTPANMNYAVLVFGATLFFSILWWFVRGKKTFVGP